MAAADWRPQHHLTQARDPRSARSRVAEGTGATEAFLVKRKQQNRPETKIPKREQMAIT
jgi:hypothetical protein